MRRPTNPGRCRRTRRHTLTSWPKKFRPGLKQRRLFMRASVFWCETKEGWVFMSVPKNKYYALPSQKCDGLRDWICTASQPRDGLRSPNQFDSYPAIVNSLQLKGLCSSRESRRVRSMRRPDLATEHFSRPATLTAIDAATVIMCFVISAMFVRALLMCRQLWLLVRVISWYSSRFPSVKAMRSSVDTDLSAFFALRPYCYSAYENCLLDSLVLRVFMALRGHDAIFVTGVSLRPFRAHAWVQNGSTVLNDGFENVLEYMPIMWI